MMEQAMKDISSSDIFIAETSHKAIGIVWKPAMQKQWVNPSFIYDNERPIQPLYAVSVISR